MIARSSEPLRTWFQLCDLVAVGVAWIIADFVRLRSGWVPLAAPDMPSFSLCLGQLPLVLLLAWVCFRISGMYDVTRLSRFREELYQVAKGVTFLVLLVMCVTFAMQSPYRPRGVFAILLPVAILGIILARRFSWFTLGRLRARGYNQTHALVVGTGRLARQTVRTLNSASWMGIQTVAYVEDDEARHPRDLPVVGPISELPRLVQELHIEHVFLALPMNRYADVRRVFDLLSQTTVEMRLIADAPAMSALSLTTTNLHGMTVIGLRENRYYGFNIAIKRVMDFVLSLVGLIVLSPLLIVIALAVKLTSRGPIFFRQTRCSLDGQSFEMLKFRSMFQDAEKGTGAVWASKDDPRCTKIGAFLRKSNLDELPQLFNILWGDMSLVGPRPERPEFVSQFKHTIPNYMARHAVKAGLTGWAQVNGWRGNSSLRRRIQFDLYYITHWNPFFDLRIMILTVFTMLFKKQKHAY